MRQRILRLLPVVLCASLFACSAASGQAAEPLPPQGASPPGTNDFACKPPPMHPYPVILVHGTFENMIESWNAVAPALTRLGYCVFALDYGNSPIPGVNAVGDIPTSARQLDTFVNNVLESTGAKKVAFIGHSQGGMMPRYLIKFLDGTGRVDELVGFSPSNHGTTNPLAGPAGQFGCPACAQQLVGSDFINQLNAGDQTPAPVSYTVVQTNHDEVVTPYESAFLPEAAGRVTNVLLQDNCPDDQAEHIGTQYDPVAIQWALAALGRPGPADPNFKPDCSGIGLASFPDSSSVEGDGPANPSGDGGQGHRPRLVVGHLPQHASVTRHRRLRTAAAARGVKLQNVVVTVRRGGKALGKSKPRKLSGRHAIVVHLKHRLGRGRYTAIATGRSAGGTRFRGERSFTLR
jgi:triacylglycerol lipase